MRALVLRQLSPAHGTNQHTGACYVGFGQSSGVQCRNPDLDIPIDRKHQFFHKFGTNFAPHKIANSELVGADPVDRGQPIDRENWCIAVVRNAFYKVHLQPPQHTLLRQVASYGRMFGRCHTHWRVCHKILWPYDYTASRFHHGQRLPISAHTAQIKNTADPIAASHVISISPKVTRAGRSARCLLPARANAPGMRLLRAQSQNIS